MIKQVTGAIVVLSLIVVYLCTFRVYEYQEAILFQLGKIQRSDYEPGLHFKLPFVQNVRTFDKRLQTLDAEPQRFLTGEKKDVIVDSFARWRIHDVVQFYKSSDGDPRRAGLLLYQKVNDGLRSEFGKRTVQEVVSGERGAIMKSVTRIANERGLDLGMEI
jgi:membrane protease subunit HflC